MIAGNEGILSKAENAVSETKISGAKEQAELLLAEVSAEYYEKRFVDKTETGALVDYIKTGLASGKEASNGEYTVTIDGSANVTVTDEAGNVILEGTLDENGKVVWAEHTSGGMVVQPTDAKYFAFSVNEDGTTAKITGVKDEYALKAYWIQDPNAIQYLIAIKDGENYITDVAIPMQVTDDAGNKYTVTSIGASAFESLGATQENIQNGDVSAVDAIFTSFVIPDTVTTIETLAFAYNTEVTQIKMPDSLIDIGSYAFAQCTSLNNVNIPDTVTTIGDYAFYKDKSLSNLTFGKSVKSIGKNAFNLLDNLSSVNIPDGVESIGYGAFANCKKISSVTIPASVTTVGGLVFNNCNSLTSISVDSANQFYDSRENCNALIETSTNKLLCGIANTVIPSSVTTIDSMAFAGCDGLTSIIIPDGVTKIGGMAFVDCKNLNNIHISSSVTSIGSNAFSNCANLTSVTIDSSTVATGLTSQTARGYIINNATTVYIKSGITPGSYITNTANFTEGDSDKEGYVMYTKN